MIATRFRSVYWVGGVAVAALGCYLVSQRVAAERQTLTRVETEILAGKRAIRALRTEIGTRAGLNQIERWNADVLALQAPKSSQLLASEVQLAALLAPVTPAMDVPAATAVVPVAATAAPEPAPAVTRASYEPTEPPAAKPAAPAAKVPARSEVRIAVADPAPAKAEAKAAGRTAKVELRLAAKETRRGATEVKLAAAEPKHAGADAKAERHDARGDKRHDAAEVKLAAAEPKHARDAKADKRDIKLAIREAKKEEAKRGTAEHASSRPRVELAVRDAKPEKDKAKPAKEKARGKPEVRLAKAETASADGARVRPAVYVKPGRDRDTVALLDDRLMSDITRIAARERTKDKSGR